jgi:hypothetical protein
MEIAVDPPGCSRILALPPESEYLTADSRLGS